MPNLSLNFTQLTALAHDATKAKTYTRETAWATLRAGSLAAERGIKSDMPVDTGRARASWGHWTPAAIKGKRRAASVEVAGGGAGDAVYEESEGSLTITQGSNVEYIIYLNAGHSRQAPGGFIDKRALKAQLALEERLGLIDPTSPAAQQIRYVAQFE